MLQTTPTDPAALARRPDTAGPLAVATPTTRKLADASISVNTRRGTCQGHARVQRLAPSRQRESTLRWLQRVSTHLRGVLVSSAILLRLDQAACARSSGGPHGQDIMVAQPRRVVENIARASAQGSILPAVHTLAFEQPKEALRRRVIRTTACGAHAADDSMALQETLVLLVNWQPRSECRTTGVLSSRCHLGHDLCLGMTEGVVTCAATSNCMFKSPCPTCYCIPNHAANLVHASCMGASQK